MKKVIALVCVLLVAAGCVWWFVMDPASVDRYDIGAIEVREIGSILNENQIAYEDHVFRITDENHIRYIVDFLNNIIPIPGTLEADITPMVLTLLDHQGNEIAGITVHGNNYLVTDKGTFQADMGELVSNLSRIGRGEDIRVSMAAFGIYMISWLFVTVVAALAGMILYLIQMTICYKTDSLSLRLLPTAIILLFCLMNYHTQIMTGLFYFLAALAFNSTAIGILLISSVATISIILGWRTGAKARREAAS